MGVQSNLVPNVIVEVSQVDELFATIDELVDLVGVVEDLRVLEAAWIFSADDSNGVNLGLDGRPGASQYLLVFDEGRVQFQRIAFSVFALAVVEISKQVLLLLFQRIDFILPVRDHLRSSLGGLWAIGGVVRLVVVGCNKVGLCLELVELRFSSASAGELCLDSRIACTAA